MFYNVYLKGESMSNSKFKLVKVDYKYVEYLREFDNKVPYNVGIKELRPFLGILFVVDNCEYFAPLSSPKPKHITMKNNLDIIKIHNGKYGVVNFNNMIPVTPNNYVQYNIYKSTNNTMEQRWNHLLQIQIVWLNKNISLVKSKAIKLYNMYNNNTLNESIRNRCCDFKLLEEMCDQYNMLKTNNI